MRRHYSEPLSYQRDVASLKGWRVKREEWGPLGVDVEYERSSWWSGLVRVALLVVAVGLLLWMIFGRLPQ